ncbi:MAG: hypothetical protein ACYC3I_07330, partial [Gemmataceae bacterium]
FPQRRLKSIRADAADMGLLDFPKYISNADLSGISPEEFVVNASTKVPVIITPDAAARIAERGRQKELEQMVAYIHEVVPELAAIELRSERSASSAAVWAIDQGQALFSDLLLVTDRLP